MCKNAGLRKWQTCSLPLEMRIRFKATLAAALPSQPTEEQDVEKAWGVPKSALNETEDTLPKLPQRQEKEWALRGCKTYSGKKHEAWQCLWQNGRSHSELMLQDQYRHYCKLTKAAAE